MRAILKFAQSFTFAASICTTFCSPSSAASEKPKPALSHIHPPPCGIILQSIRIEVSNGFLRVPQPQTNKVFGDPRPPQYLGAKSAEGVMS